MTAYYDMYCESPRSRHAIDIEEGRDDWPFGGFPATVTAQQVADAFRSHLRHWPDLDHITFTTYDRLDRPLLDAHLVNGRIHIKVADLHTATAETRAIVHALQAAITEAFAHIEGDTIDITPNAAGFERWARAVLAEAPADSADAEAARKVLDILRGNQPD